MLDDGPSWKEKTLVIALVVVTCLLGVAQVLQFLQL